MKFEYYEIRACVDDGETTESFLGLPVSNNYDDEVCTPEGALSEARGEALANGIDPAEVFWTLYGRYWEDGCLLAEAIGDFKTFEAAYEVQCAILAPMREAADMVANDDGHSADDAAAMLEDICNQSSHEERL